jgi:hypothetical protein
MREDDGRMAKRIFMLSGLLLVFAYGVAVGAYRVFPFRILKSGIDSVQQVWQERRMITETRPDDLLERSRYPGEGLTRFDPDRASPGLTLMAGFFGDANELRLVELDGTIVRSWPARYFEAFPEPTHIAPERLVPAREWNTNIHGSLALPDGSVVFNYNYNGTVKLDRCGEVVWTVPRMTHHSLELASDGGFWVPGRRYLETGGDFPLFEGPYEEDFILKISPAGEVVSETSVPKLLFDGGLLPLWLANGQYWVRNVPTVELVHLNDIEELSADMAAAFPQFDAGDLVISLRQLNLVFVVDPDTRAIKWRQTGPWIRQHDPDFRPDGTISIFNNNADDTDDGSILGGSSIVVVDPETGAVSTTYGGSAEQPMYTHLRGGHQYLENGNILITEDGGGRVFEITPDGEVVWEYINRYDEESVARVSLALRYPPDYFTVADWSCADQPNLP